MDEDLGIKTSLKSYKCSGCNSTYSASNLPLATCVFCGGILSQVENKGIDLNAKMLPFTLTANEASKAYLKALKGKLLLPSVFKKKSTINNMKQFYINSYAYDLVAKGKLSFTANDIIEGKKGTSATTKTYMVEEDIECTFAKVLVGQYNTNSDLLENIGPFNYSTMTQIQPGFLNNAFILNSENDPDEFNKVKDKVITACVNSGLNKVRSVNKNVAENNITVTTLEYNTILVPAYLFKTAYHGKDYFFLVNGNTGKVVGNITFSITKAIILGIIFALLLSVLILVAVAVYSIHIL